MFERKLSVVCRCHQTLPPIAEAAVVAAAAVVAVAVVLGGGGGTLSLSGPDMPVPLSYAADNGLFDLPWDSIKRSNSVGEATKE